MTSQTAARYRLFAEREAAGRSPAYERLAAEVADDPRLLALLDEVEPWQRQPNLLFAALRRLGAPLTAGAAVERWAEIEPILRTRRTQTNEPGRWVLAVAQPHGRALHWLA